PRQWATCRDSAGKLDFDRPLQRHRIVPPRGQQFSVLDARPAHLSGCLDVVSGDVARQSPVDAFIEQHLHETDWTSRSFASSKKAMTCSRVTDGKPSRNSSIESPASR